MWWTSRVPGSPFSHFKHSCQIMHFDWCRKMSSKKWLSQNGLAAKKLTIIDLLAPTFISHEPKYVPSINRKVLSKVFDEVRVMLLLFVRQVSSEQFLPHCMECRRGLAMRILSVYLSVCPSVCLSNTCIVTKQKKDLSRFLYHTKDHLA